ncbi:hypothetical protein KCU61_g518, partial [Aureobasidium melanogenum]
MSEEVSYDVSQVKHRVALAPGRNILNPPFLPRRRHRNGFLRFFSPKYLAYPMSEPLRLPYEFTIWRDIQVQVSCPRHPSEARERAQTTLPYPVDQQIFAVQKVRLGFMVRRIDFDP